MDLSALTALILAGGLGTRLRPIVPDGPKALAPLQGRPFLEYQVEWLARQGVRRIVLCLGHANHAIIDHFGDGARFGVAIRASVEPLPLGTAGALALVRDLVTTTAVAMNGDTFYADDLAPMLAQHRTTGACMTIGAGIGNGRAGGQMVTDAARRVTRFAEKSEVIPAAWVSAGLYLLEPAVLAAIPAGRAVSLERETIPALLAAGLPVYVYPLQHGFWDMGTPEGYARLANHISMMRLPADDTSGMGAP